MGWLGGLLGGIGGFILGGPAGAITGATMGIGVGGHPSAGGVTPASSLPAAMGGTPFRSMPGATFGRQPSRGFGFSDPVEQPGPPSGAGVPGGKVVAVGPDGALCTLPHHHLNKSKYFRKRPGIIGPLVFGAEELVEKGTACVKNRRMNVGNARALRHALRRARGFEKLAMRTIHLLHPAKRGRFGGFKTRGRARR
jgi:hypothetical protein